MTYLRLRQSLQQAEFREFFEAITGLELGSVTTSVCIR